MTLEKIRLVHAFGDLMLIESLFCLAPNIGGFDRAFLDRMDRHVDGQLCIYGLLCHRMTGGSHVNGSIGIDFLLFLHKMQKSYENSLYYHS